MMAPHDMLNSPIVAHLGWTILHSIWQVAAISLVVGLLLPAWRRRGPEFAYSASCLALGSCLLFPMMTFYLLPVAARVDRVWPNGGSDQGPISQQRSLKDPRVLPERAAAVGQDRAEVDVHLGDLANKLSQPLVERQVSEPEPFFKRSSVAAAHRWLVLTWICGICLLSFWNCGTWFAAQRLRSHGTARAPSNVLTAADRIARQLGIRQAYGLLTSTLVESPVVVGALKPIILLPIGLVTQLSSDQLQALIAHELAHIRRQDYLVNLLQTAIETLLFYHPCVWWLSTQIRHDREFCCDDLALRVTTDRTIYASALAAVVFARVPSIVPAASGGPILMRFQRILKATQFQEGQSARGLVGTALLSLVIAAVLSTIPGRIVAVEPTQAGDVLAPKAADSKPSLSVAARDASWASVRHDAGLTGVASTSLPESLDKLWDIQMNDAVQSTAAIVGEFVYVPCLSGELDCRDRITGRRIWTYPAIENRVPNKLLAGFHAAPTVTKDAVYLGDEDGVFHSIDRATGKNLWTFATGGKIQGSAAVTDGRILFGSEDSNLYCLRLDGTQAWTCPTEGYLFSTPAVVDRTAIVVGCDGYLRTIDIGTGQQQWHLQLAGIIASSPAVVDHMVYVGTHDGELYAVDWKAQEIVWKYSSINGSPYMSSAAVTDDLVIIAGHDKSVCAIDRTTGKENWMFPTRAMIDSSPVVVGDRVIVSSNDGNLYALDLKDGFERGKVNIGNRAKSSPAVGEGVLVISSERPVGHVFCFGKKP